MSAAASPPSAARLLAWYGRHRRHLPWRAAPGHRADPYHVWLSEIMLQQTQVATVIPYYGRFLAAYPRIADLAAAQVQEVLGHWAGLGYYARGRNLHECAVAVGRAGGFPADYAGLLALPGIGPYTAAAIGAIAFDLPLLPVDGNIERIAARVFAIAAPLPQSRKAIAAAASTLLEQPAARASPGDFAQALFDLGAGICTPRRPACGICPWMAGCRGRALGIAPTLPARQARAARPRREGAVYVLLDPAERVLLERRPDRGLLGGMPGLPETPPLPAEWRVVGSIAQVFTHFSLTLTVHLARARTLPPGLAAPAAAAALPSVMRKAVDLALAAARLDGGHADAESSRDAAAFRSS